jgi:Beta-L-arabinofuranosidase, GH127
LRFAPFDSLPWLRADLTGEKASASDGADWGHVRKRPFKNYSGDISGRFLEIMAMRSREGLPVHPAFRPLLAEVPKLQRPGGYFCASGDIDWQQPIDHPKKGEDALGSRMLPALWGNARLLCALVEAMRAFPDDKSTATAARALGDFYVSMLPRFNDPKRIAEYTAGGTYAAGYVTCWFPAMEGLVKLGALTGEGKYLTAAAAMADFHQQFDQVPVDHAHGMLCNHVSLLLLYEAGGKPVYRERVEKRWEELVQGGYINPAGGILEKCHVRFVRDEGCAIDDWLRLNLALARITGKPRYWAMAERTLHNHLLQNQSTKGGFGHRHIHCDEDGACGFGKDIEESTWCCSFHGELGFIQVRDHLLSRSEALLTCRFALDFGAVDAVGTTTSLLRPGQKPGEVLRQRLSLTGQPTLVVRVRRPHWADEVRAVDPTNQLVSLEEKDGWISTASPVTEVEFIYEGSVYAENRRYGRLPGSPGKGELFVVGYGPKLLAAQGRPPTAITWPSTLSSLAAQGLHPLSPAMRCEDCSFVFRRVD